MKLIILYGLPASGKLTIASKVSKLSGLTLLHNHLTHDFFHSIVKERNKSFWSSLQKIRLIILEQLIKNNQDMIMTYTTATSSNNSFPKKIIKLAKKYGVKVHFFHIACKPETILKRCIKKSRTKFEKPQNVKIIKEEIEKKDLFSKFNFVKSISINTDKLSAEKSAQKIIKEI